MTLAAAAARTTVSRDHLPSLARLHGSNNGGGADGSALALLVIPAYSFDGDGNGDGDGDGDGTSDGDCNSDGNGDGHGDSNGNEDGDGKGDDKVDGDEDGDEHQMEGGNVLRLLIGSWQKWQQRGRR